MHRCEYKIIHGTDPDNLALVASQMSDTGWEADGFAQSQYAFSILMKRSSETLSQVAAERMERWSG